MECIARSELPGMELLVPSWPTLSLIQANVIPSTSGREVRRVVGRQLLRIEIADGLGKKTKDQVGRGRKES